MFPCSWEDFEGHVLAFEHPAREHRHFRAFEAVSGGVNWPLDLLCEELICPRGMMCLVMLLE